MIASLIYTANMKNLAYFVTVCFAVFCTETESLTCPTNYSPYASGLKCIRIVTSYEDRDDSELICEADDGHLASITSSEENTYIKNNINAYSEQYYWIGLNDRDSENEFKWADGTVAGYTYWNTDPSDYQPNGDSDCVTLRETRDHRWFDRSCGYKYKSLCQWEPSPLTVFCSVLSPIDPNAILSTSATNYLTGITESCVYGYMAASSVDQGKQSCNEDGDWIKDPVYGNFVVCLEIMCPTLLDIATASKTSSGRRYQDYVSYTCDDGYQHSSGQLNRTCSFDDSWDGDQPSCSHIPGYPRPGNLYKSVIAAENLTYKRKLVSARARSMLDCASMCEVDPACSALSFSPTSEGTNCVQWVYVDPGDNNDDMVTWDLFLKNVL